MTKDTSPENLRKFLESDDPALVLMGLSMAEGIGVTDKILGEILWMYMFNDDKTIRAIAKSTFIKLAPKDAKQAVKENWKASYRTERLAYRGSDPPTGLGKLHNICQELSSLGLDDARPIERIIQIFQSTKSVWYRENTAVILGKIGDARAVEPLIKALGDDWRVRRSATEALGKIGKSAVEPLIKELGGGNGYYSWYAAEALGKIGDKRAVNPLIKALMDKHVKQNAAEALGKIGDTRAVEPLIELLEDEDEYVREAAKEALRKLGHEVE